jgi:Spy/CpxP family protein refolding chaperone
MDRRLVKRLAAASFVVCISGMSGIAAAMPSGGWHDDDMMGAPGHHSQHHGQDGGGHWGKWGGMGMDSQGHMTARLRMVWSLDLSDEQRSKIRKLQRDLRAKVWAIEDKIEDTSDELMKLYRAEKRDAKKIGAVYDKIFDMRRQKIEAMIEAGNAVEDVLTDKQRKQLKKMRHSPRWGAGWDSDRK